MPIPLTEAAKKIEALRIEAKDIFWGLDNYEGAKEKFTTLDTIVDGELLNAKNDKNIAMINYLTEVKADVENKLSECKSRIAEEKTPESRFKSILLVFADMDAAIKSPPPLSTKEKEQVLAYFKKDCGDKISAIQKDYDNQIKEYDDLISKIQKYTQEDVTPQEKDEAIRAIQQEKDEAIRAIQTIQPILGVMKTQYEIMESDLRKALDAPPSPGQTATNTTPPPASPLDDSKKTSVIDSIKVIVEAIPKLIKIQEPIDGMNTIKPDPDSTPTVEECQGFLAARKEIYEDSFIAKQEGRIQLLQAVGEDFEGNTAIVAITNEVISQSTKLLNAEKITMDHQIMEGLIASARTSFAKGDHADAQLKFDAIHKAAVEIKKEWEGQVTPNNGEISAHLQYLEKVSGYTNEQIMQCHNKNMEAMDAEAKNLLKQGSHEEAKSIFHKMQETAASLKQDCSDNSKMFNHLKRVEKYCTDLINTCDGKIKMQAAAQQEQLLSRHEIRPEPSNNFRPVQHSTDAKEIAASAVQQNSSQQGLHEKQDSNSKHRISMQKK